MRILLRSFKSITQDVVIDVVLFQLFCLINDFAIKSNAHFSYISSTFQSGFLSKYCSKSTTGPRLVYFAISRSRERQT